MGQYEKAIEFLDKAIRLSPRDPNLFFWYSSKSFAYFALHKDDQAIDWARRAIAINPNWSFSRGILTADLH
jgi:tetratricopeptide (TPR) repeat protein